MARLALLCPPFPSHLAVFGTLAERLEARGHAVTFLVNAGAEASLASKFRVRAVAAPPGADAADVVRRAARPGGLFGILGTVADTAALTDALCGEGPAILGEIGSDMLIGDEMEPAAGLLAAHLGLPHVSIAAALPIESAPGVPPPFLPWPFDTSPAGLKRNAGGERVARLLLSRQRQTLTAWSGRFGLDPRRSLEDCLSPDLTIAQTVPGFDFPRPPSPRFRTVGPIRRWSEADLALPFEPDPGRPFVFASLGTLQGNRLGLWRRIVAGCRLAGAQVLVAHCGGLSRAQAASLGADFVTDFAPQRAVLARADLCITHGGMNTVMDALEAGTPMLAIPLAFDQPGIAARIAHHGVGMRLSRVFLSPERIASSLSELLALPHYREKAAALGREIAGSGGAEAAADLIESFEATQGGRRHAAA